MSAHDFTVTDIDGKPTTLKEATGGAKAVLVVNLASRCGLTPQYAGLNQLYDELHGKGFSIAGFPCNQFGRQEPGSNAEIKDFACGRGARWPLFAKIDVNGPKADPLYTFLKQQQGNGEDIAWNMGKFLVDGRTGAVVKRYDPRTEPAAIKPDIEKLLASA